jgi:hypothetical protein
MVKKGLLTLAVNKAFSDAEEIRVQKLEARVALGAFDAQAASGASMRRQKDTDKTFAFRLARTPQARRVARAGPWLNDTIGPAVAAAGKTTELTSGLQHGIERL